MKRSLHFAALFLFLAAAVAAQVPKPLPTRILEKIPQQMRMHVPMYSGAAAITKAMRYNLDLQGKPVPQTDGMIVPQKAKKLTDVPIAHEDAR